MKQIVTKTQGTLSNFTGRNLLYLKKYSPEIMLAIGIGGIIGSTVLACKATLKVEEVLEEASEKITNIKDAKETFKNDEHIYSESDHNRDLAIVYAQTGVKLLKLYGPAIGLGAISIGSVVGSHKIMKGRNVALAAAYKLVDEGFKDYRRRVIEELGDGADRHFRHGIKAEEIEYEVETDGKKEKIKEVVDIVSGEDVSIYARFFDEYSPNWTNNPEMNLLFLKTQQNYANDKLRARGHIFLNEVYDMLGLDRTKAGAHVGWVLGNGDGYVDFGIYDHTKPIRRKFVNGLEPSILLDFNVDGVILDLI